MDQPDSQRPSAPTAKGLSPAVSSLNREFLTVLVSEEASAIGRSIAQIQRGDGWQEARSSAVLTEAIVNWLGRDPVATAGFYADGAGPVEIMAHIGAFYLTGHGVENEEDLMVKCCERHRARFSQSRIEHLELAQLGNRFSWNTPLGQRAASRLAVLLREAIDAEIALVVLGV